MKQAKTYLVLIMLIKASFNLFAQSNIYKPFPQVYGNWIVEEWGPLGPGQPGSVSWKKYEAFGDTLIGSYTYKKVTVADNTSYPNGQNVIPFGPAMFCFAYRNDIVNKKVYYLDPTGGLNNDVLWYRFDLNIGDTIKDSYSFTNPIGFNSNARRIVYSIDSVLSCGTYYKRFNFTCGGGFETNLIEGQGYKDRFTITNYPDCPFEPSYIYTTTFSTCNITPIIDYIQDNQFKLSPNPANSELKINGPLEIVNFSVTNNLGETILNGNSTNTINVSSLTDGLYVLKVKGREGKYYQSKFIKQ